MYEIEGACMSYLDYVLDCVNNRKVVIAPMGIAGKSMADKLLSIGISVDFFYDNNEKMWGGHTKILVV